MLNQQRNVSLEETPPQAPGLEDIRRALGSRRPRTVPGCRAAVAVVCCERAGTLHLLFIKRAERAGDPWSGHLAFPGGRIEADDPGPRAAAERETREEVGLDLGPEEYLGRLDDLATVTTSMRVAAFVYGISEPLPLRGGDEVEEAFWYPFAELLDPERRALREFEHRGERGSWPSIDLRRPGSPFLWGVTYRFVAHLAELIGRPLPGG